MFGSPGFSSAAVESVLRGACVRVGLDHRQARLLRLGENAIFVLEDEDVVVRIARSAQRMERVERELCMARWLHDVGVPAVEVHEDTEQPILVEARPVTFWKRIHECDPKPRHRDLASLLARLHSLPESPCSSPSFQPLALVRTRIASTYGVSANDRNYLLAHHRELSEQYKRLEFALPVGPIHGDAWVGNLLRDKDHVRLLDFEMSGFGPREWDLIPTAIATSRYGLSKDDYREFCTTYGFDVTQWSGYMTLRAIRELTMTTWLMQNIGENSAIREEFELRVNSIRRKDLDRAWRAF